MHRIYCFNNGGGGGLYSAVAIADTGKVVGNHCCSHEGFMRHDLGITSDWKHDGYNAEFGEGNWELEWVDNSKEHEGIQKAFELNSKLED